MSDSASTIEFTCESCEQAYRVKAELAGKKMKCKCSHVMHIPQPAADDQPGVLDLDDLGIAAQPANFSKQCPSCNNDLPASAILCINCGYNLNTGKQANAANSGRDSSQKPKLSQPTNIFKVVKYANYLLIFIAVINGILVAMDNEIYIAIGSAAFSAIAPLLVLKIIEEPPGSEVRRAFGYLLNFLATGGLFFRSISIITLSLTDPASLPPEIAREVHELQQDAAGSAALVLTAIIYACIGSVYALNLYAIYKIKRI